MKILTLIIATFVIGGCAGSPVPSTGESNSKMVKKMATKALEVCGQGNVKSVTLSDFKCFTKPNR